MDTNDIVSDRLMTFGADRPGEKPSLFLWGDSHAVAAFPALDLYARLHGLTGRAALHSGTSPLLGYYTRGAYGLNEKTIPYSQAVFDYIQRNHIPRVFLVCLWKRDLLLDPAGMENALVRTIEAFRPTGVKLYVMLQVPTQPADVPRVLALDTLAPAPPPDWRETVRAHRSEQAALYRIAAQYASPQCTFIDPAPALADPDGEHYQVIRDGHPLYLDQTHISVYGSRTILEPLLERVLGAP